MASTQNAWLALAVKGKRQHGGNDGYVDVVDAEYSWDSTVPNHAGVSAGDVIVVWDKSVLLGASVIQDIIKTQSEKTIYRCPICDRASIKKRTSASPVYRCNDCKSEFDSPTIKTVEVTSYKSVHDANWVDLGGALSGTELRGLCVSPQSQLSLRPLRWSAFKEAIEDSELGEATELLDFGAEQLAGGHSLAVVRVRVGQAAFRRKLLKQYGAICAVTGPTPEWALEAGHLYSYANHAVHYEKGGLLLRRDIHRLFDLGYIAINPDTHLVDISPSLASFPLCSDLADAPLSLTLEHAHEHWLLQHWAQFRSGKAIHKSAEGVA